MGKEKFNFKESFSSSITGIQVIILRYETVTLKRDMYDFQ